MFQSGQEMFVSFGGGGNALDPVVVSGADVASVRLRFVDDEAPEGASREDQGLMLYFNGPDGFMQQPAKVVEPVGEDGEIGVVTTGDAVSGESRQFFRVSTVLSSYEAIVEGAPGCKIVDVSSMGLAVIVEGERGVGDALSVSFPLGVRTFSGECVVQSVRETGAGWRLGLLCVNGAGSGDLDVGLHALTMQAQRDQLKRLSGAA